MKYFTSRPQDLVYLLIKTGALIFLCEILLISSMLKTARHSPPDGLYPAKRNGGFALFKIKLIYFLNYYDLRYQDKVSATN